MGTQGLIIAERFWLVAGCWLLVANGWWLILVILFIPVIAVVSFSNYNSQKHVIQIS